MSKKINYDVLRRHSQYPEFDYKNTVEDEPVFLEKNYKYIAAKEAINNVGGECRAEIINNYWLLIYYKLGSFTGCIMAANWRAAPATFLQLMLEANIFKQTLF